MSEKMMAASNKPWNLRMGCRVISQANEGVRQHSKNSLVSLIFRNSGGDKDESKSRKRKQKREVERERERD